MKFIKKYYGILIGAFFVLGFLFYISKDSQKLRKYEKNMPFNRSYVNIQIYTSDISLGKKVIKELENLYTYYNKLITREKTDEKGIYYIEKNKEKAKKIKINKDLYNVLRVGKKWEEESKWKINLSSYPIQKLWDKNLRNEKIPKETDIELKKVEIKENGKIENNHLEIMVDGIINGYVSEKVKDLLNKYGVSMYLINTDGTILAGKPYTNRKYQIALDDIVDKSYYSFLNASNETISTKGIGEIFFEKDGKIYHNRIDPSKKSPSSYHRAVTVIAKDSILADTLSQTLFHMSLEEGKKYIENYKDVEVIWYSNDKTVTFSDKMEKDRIKKEGTT